MPTTEFGRTSITLTRPANKKAYIKVTLRNEVPVIQFKEK